MKKLNKKQIDELNKLRWAIEDARDALEVEINAYNEALAEAWGRIESAKEVLDEKITAANEWRAEIAGEMQEYFDERSERWQESDAGSEYQDWLNEWDQEFPEVELERPDDLEMPEVETPELLENLPEEVSG